MALYCVQGHYVKSMELSGIFYFLAKKIAGFWVNQILSS